jgi:hypothetical protein
MLANMSLEPDRATRLLNHSACDLDDGCRHDECEHATEDHREASEDDSDAEAAAHAVPLQPAHERVERERDEQRDADGDQHGRQRRDRAGQ